MPKSRFRIIAIRPITPTTKDEDILRRVRSIQKKVFGAEWLYFYSGYKLNEDKGAVVNYGDNHPLYGHTLTVKGDSDKDRLLFDTNSLSVSVSAIVGPNGSGKSSAVELMIRILNNLSVAAKGETKNHLASEHLYFIEDVYGCFVVMEGDHFFQIQCYGRSIRIASYSYDIEQKLYVCGQMDEWLTEGSDNRFVPITGNIDGVSILYQLFYSAIFNYSMYSFNYQDYYEERTLEDRWNEELDDKTGHYYEGEYNQDRCWLKGLFHKNDGYQTPIVLNPMRDEGIIDVPKENGLSSERIRNMLFYENDTKKGHGGQPFFPFRIVNGHLEVVAIRMKAIRNPKFDKDHVIETLKLQDTPIAQHFKEMRDIICHEWCAMMCMAYQENTEHEKLAWDYVVYKTLKIITTYDKYHDCYNALILFDKIDQKEIHRQLILMRNDNSHITLKLRQALNFLKFTVFREHYDEIIPLYAAYKRYKKIIKTFEEMNLRVDYESGHVLMNDPKGYRKKDLPHFHVDVKAGTLRVTLPDNNSHPIPQIFLDNGHLVARFPGDQEIMPPPIFDMTLMLMEADKIKENGSYDKRDIFPMSGLSSGERQIAGAVSNFAYHLANIDSVWEDKNGKVIGKFPNLAKVTDDITLVRYKYVNVIFDEVELYFHPDLQRRFVRHLTEALQNLNLEHLEGVNIMLVTHSPFVLSDLPRANVLALGNEGDEVKETFCANIHEMLGNSFFMKYTVGDLAKERVEEILRLYSEFEASDDKESVVGAKATKWEKYEYVASLIADDYLKGLVNRMLDEMRSYLPKTDYTAEELDKMIEAEEQKLQDLRAKREKIDD